MKKVNDIPHCGSGQHATGGLTSSTSGACVRTLPGGWAAAGVSFLEPNPAGLRIGGVFSGEGV